MLVFKGASLIASALLHSFAIDRFPQLYNDRQTLSYAEPYARLSDISTPLATRYEQIFLNPENLPLPQKKRLITSVF